MWICRNFFGYEMSSTKTRHINVIESPWVLLIRAYILAVLVSFGNMGHHGDRNWPKRWRNTLLSNSLWFDDDDDDDDDGGIIHSPMRSYHILFHQKSFHLSHQVKFPGVPLWELEVLGWFVMTRPLFSCRGHGSSQRCLPTKKPVSWGWIRKKLYWGYVVTLINYPKNGHYPWN